MKKYMKQATLGSIAPFTYGKGLLKSKRNHFGRVPVYGSNGIIDYHDTPLTDGPTIIIGRKGTVGAVHFSRIPCWPIDTTFYITSSDISSLKFQYYLLRSLDMHLMNSDSAVPGLNREHAHAIRINIPNKKTQKSIANILGSLDDKIELNRRMNKTLEEMTRALFKSWFVDFDPVRAKMDGRWKSGQSLPGLPAELYDLFPNRFVPSELGDIPEGWQIVPIQDTSTIVGGTTPSTKQPLFWEGGHHFWATPKDLSALTTPVLMRTNRKITDKGLARISSGLLPIGTVLMSSRAPIGYLAIAEVSVAINQGFIAMLPKPNISNLFLLYWCEYFKSEIINHANGSTFLEINKRNFRQILMTISDPLVMSRFDDNIQPLYNRIKINETENNILANIRDTLLPKLISGEIRVDELDIEL